MKRSSIYGITYGCPHGKRENSCPLLEIGSFSFKEKINWINELNEEKKVTIWRHHVYCSKRRDNKPSLC